MAMPGLMLTSSNAQTCSCWQAAADRNSARYRPAPIAASAQRRASCRQAGARRAAKRAGAQPASPAACRAFTGSPLQRARSNGARLWGSQWLENSAQADVAAPLEQCFKMWEDRERIPQVGALAGGALTYTLSADSRGNGAVDALDQERPGAAAGRHAVQVAAVHHAVRPRLADQLAGAQPDARAQPEDPLALRAGAC